MRLNRTARYAVKALAYMAAHPESRMFPSHIVAKGIGAPALLMLKVLNDLVDKGVLLSLRGPNGGYALGRAPKQISILDGIEAVEGKVRGEMPLGSHEGAVNLRLKVIADEVAAMTRRRLGRVTIAELSKEI